MRGRLRRAVGAVSAIAMVGSLLVGVAPATASATPLPQVQLSLSPTPAYVSSGGTVTVNVEATVSNTTYGMGAFQFDIQYNNADVMATACSILPGSSTCNASYTSDSVAFTWASTTGLTGSQNLGTVTFQGLSGGVSSLSDLTFTNVKVADTTGAALSYGVTDGQIGVAPVLGSITGSPVSGPETGGTYVTLNGTGLLGATAVAFGSNDGTIVSNTATQIVVISPASTTGAGAVNVTVTNSGGTSNALTFTYTSDPYTSFVGVWVAPQTQAIAPGATATVTVDSLAPTQELGGWTVTLTYDNAVLSFTGCTGNSGCSAPVVSGSTSTITISHATGTGLSGTNPLVAMTFKGQTSGTSPITLGVTTFVDPSGTPISPYTITNGSVSVNSAPTITNVSPTSGWPGGGASGDGTPVTITGTNFLNPTVKIGGQTATVVTSSSTSITVDVPAESAAVTGEHAVGDVNGDGSITSVDALCILRAVAGFPYAGSCVGPYTDTVSIVVTGSDGQTVTATQQYTYNRFDLTSNDGGTPNSVDALCVLRSVLFVGPTTSCPAALSATP